MSENPLGKQVTYPDKYSPEQLVAIPRALNRAKLGIGEELPFTGADIWNAWECSWLDDRGKPVSVILRLVIPCTTPNIVESKSLKLYFNSFNQEQYEDSGQVLDTIQKDLTSLLEEQVYLSVYALEGFDIHTQQVPGQTLDGLGIRVTATEPDSGLLETDEQSLEVTETVYTNLFRSLCPVTGQPDWATVAVSYQGKPVKHQGLLHYLLGYRTHSDYHEHCVERIFCDIKKACQPQSLTVEASFLRRGGIDINPVRTTEPGGDYLNFPRYIRQ